MTKKLLMGSTVLLMAFTSCQQNAVEQEGRGYTFRGDTATIHNDSMLIEKIKLAKVEEDVFSREVVTGATIQAIPTQFAYIASPFSGRVVRSHIRMGQRVKRNTPLFDIISADFIDVQKDFFQARSTREMAIRDMKRKQDLQKHGVGSEKELDEAANALDIAEKDYENALAAIRLFQADPDKLVFGQPLVVRAPIDGEVIENNIVTGQYLGDDSDPVAVVADLDKVWVVAQVKEKDIRFIHTDDIMKITVPAYPDLELEGKVFHIDEAVDEETRSIKVLSVCSNDKDLLKIGMYTTVHFLDKESEHIIIPEKSLLQDDANSYVFVKIGENKFVKRSVEVEASRNGKAVISKGLQKGELIIGEGGYYLK